MKEDAERNQGEGEEEEPTQRLNEDGIDSESQKGTNEEQEEATQADPLHKTYSQSMQATAYLEEGFLTWSREQCMERLSINPSDLRCIFRLGIIELSQGLLQSALDKFIHVVNSDDHLQRLISGTQTER